MCATQWVDTGASEADDVVQTLALAAGGILEQDYVCWLEQNLQKNQS
jgi:hypothetical protein